MSKRILTIGFSVIMILLAVIMMVTALGFEGKTIDTSMPGSRFFPLLTLGLIIVFSLGIILQNLRAKVPEKKDEQEEPERISKAAVLRVVSVAASGFTAYALWNMAGFLPMAAFIILAIGLILKVRSVISYVVLAAVAVLLFFVLRSLGIPLGSL